MTTKDGTPKLDPVTFEVLRNAFITTVDQMAEQVIRTCHSFVIYNRDFSCGMSDVDGNSVAQGNMDISTHVGTLHHQAKAVIAAFAGDIHDGDVFLINDPYAGGTHFNDVSAIRPVFAGGRLISFLQSKGHWTDVGGSVPGSFDIHAKEMFREGIRITPVRVVSKGRFQNDVASLIAGNTRDPHALMGDMHAQIEATNQGRRELLRLVDKYGVDTVCQAMQEVQDYAEHSLRLALSKLPDGTWESQDFVDFDPDAGEGLIPIKIRMTIKGDEIVYDFAGSHGTIGTLYNSAYGTSIGGVVAAMKMFFPDLPLNSGFYRPITVNLPDNSIVNARYPVAVSGFLMVFEKIVNGLFDVWSNVVPERSIACAFNLEYMLLGGKDGRTGKNGVFLFYDWLPGGWGGRMQRDGSNVTAACFGTGLMTQPGEGQERLTPVMADKFEILTDSPGPGQFRGGAGVIKSSVLGPNNNSVISYFCDRERAIVWGALGGLPSMPHGMSIHRKGESEPRWHGAVFSDLPISEGDRFTRSTAGGGGLGDPLDRDPRAVVEDVADGYVSIERAAEDYGVVVVTVDRDLAEYDYDPAATEAKRKSIAAERRHWIEEDPDRVAERYRTGELNEFDLVRRYGVLVDWGTGELFRKSTETFRAMMRKRSVAHWSR